LTSESEVDEKLKQMNETFLASLEGLGGGGSSKRINRSQGGSSDIGNGSGDEVVHLRRRTSAGNEVNLRLLGRGRGRSVAGGPGSGSGSASGSDMVLGTGIGGGSSDEIIGKMELDDERRRSRGY
jgi:autophagy-related protein 13